jgi:hypothetical protein
MRPQRGIVQSLDFESNVLNQNQLKIMVARCNLNLLNLTLI